MKLSRILFLFWQHYKFFGPFVFGFAIFRSLLLFYAPEFHQGFFILDIIMYWLICASTIARYREDKDRGDRIIHILRSSLFPLLFLWPLVPAIVGTLLVLFSTPFYFAPIHHFANFDEWSRFLLIEQPYASHLWGHFTLLGTFFVLDKHMTATRAIWQMVKWVKEFPLAGILLFLLFVTFATLGTHLLELAHLQEFLVNSVGLDSGALFLNQFLAYSSLIFYGATYFHSQELIEEKESSDE